MLKEIISLAESALVLSDNITQTHTREKTRQSGAQPWTKSEKQNGNLCPNFGDRFRNKTQVPD
jgi:hypothetical protein